MITTIIDRLIEGGLKLGARLPHVAAPPSGVAQQRLQASLRIAAGHHPAVRELSAGVRVHDAASVSRFDAVVAEAVAELREFSPSGLRGRLSALVDRWLYKNIEELLDDPQHSRAARVHLLDRLDRINQYLGGYAAWASMLEPMFALVPARPLRVHDLAAGHGGFALALKRQYGERIEVTASDLLEEYLGLGREHAQERGLDVRFEVRDATNLSALREQEVDVFVCTQSLHHFPPGMVARMISEAANNAGIGLCFIDGTRGPFPLVLMTLVQALYSRSWTAIHDTYATFRRTPLPEELRLMAELAPAIPSDMSIGAGFEPPGYSYLKVTRSTVPFQRASAVA